MRVVEVRRARDAIVVEDPRTLEDREVVVSEWVELAFDDGRVISFDPEDPRARDVKVGDLYELTPRGVAKVLDEAASEGVEERGAVKVRVTRRRHRHLGAKGEVFEDEHEEVVRG